MNKFKEIVYSSNTLIVVRRESAYKLDIFPYSEELLFNLLNGTSVEVTYNGKPTGQVAGNLDISVVNSQEYREFFEAEEKQKQLIEEAMQCKQAEANNVSQIS